MHLCWSRWGQSAWSFQALVHLRPTITLHSPTCWYLLFAEAWGWGAEKKKIGGGGFYFIFFFPFWGGGKGDALRSRSVQHSSDAQLGLLGEVGTIHAPARQHSSGLKRSRVTPRPHPANQSQGTNSVPFLFLVYVCALVEQTLHLVLQCALCSLTD